MKSASAVMTAKYLYVRCDDEFNLVFDNNTAFPMWRGFYCFRSDDLVRNQSSGSMQITITTSDNANLWWLSTDTLFMSVTDINNETLTGIGQLVSGLGTIISDNALSNARQLVANERQNNLLESIQNTLSIFCNAYVEANNVEDFGFITGTINNDFTCNIYIAKANKYHFNCGVSFSRNFKFNQSSTSNGNSAGVYNYASNTAYNSGDLSTSLCSYNFSNATDNTINLTLAQKAFYVPFSLYDNTNTLLSGYSISNLSVSSNIEFPVGCSLGTLVYRNSGVITSYYFGLDSTYVNNNFLTGSFDSVNSRFALSLLTNNFTVPVKKISLGTFTNPDTHYSYYYQNVKKNTIICSENLTLNFDVSKT